MKKFLSLLSVAFLMMAGVSYLEYRGDREWNGTPYYTDDVPTKVQLQKVFRENNATQLAEKLATVLGVMPIYLKKVDSDNYSAKYTFYCINNSTNENYEYRIIIRYNEENLRGIYYEHNITPTENPNFDMDKAKDRTLEIAKNFGIKLKGDEFISKDKIRYYIEDNEKLRWNITFVRIYQRLVNNYIPDSVSFSWASPISFGSIFNDGTEEIIRFHIVPFYDLENISVRITEAQAKVNAKNFLKQNMNVNGKVLKIDTEYLQIWIENSNFCYLVSVEAYDKDISWFFTGKSKNKVDYWVFVSIENGKILEDTEILTL